MFLPSVLRSPPATHEVVVRRPVEVVYRFCRDRDNLNRLKTLLEVTS
jgi:hypothetical protein